MIFSTRLCPHLLKIVICFLKILEWLIMKLCVNYKNTVMITYRYTCLTIGMWFFLINSSTFSVDDKIKLYKSQLYKCTNYSTYPRRDYIQYTWSTCRKHFYLQNSCIISFHFVIYIIYNMYYSNAWDNLDSLAQLHFRSKISK